jgi:hypothetical protein
MSSYLEDNSIGGIGCKYLSRAPLPSIQFLYLCKFVTIKRASLTRINRSRLSKSIVKEARLRFGNQGVIHLSAKNIPIEKLWFDKLILAQEIIKLELRASIGLREQPGLISRISIYVRLTLQR